MSDNFGARITFGGTLKKELLPELLRILKEELCDTAGDDVDAEVNGSIKNGEAVSFYESEARYGRFEDELEPFLAKHGLTHEIQSSAYYEYSAQTIFWKDGKESYVYCDSEHNPVVDYAELQDYMKHIKEMCANPEQIPLK